MLWCNLLGLWTQAKQEDNDNYATQHYIIIKPLQVDRDIASLEQCVSHGIRRTECRCRSGVWCTRPVWLPHQAGGPAWLPHRAEGPAWLPHRAEGPAWLPAWLSHQAEGPAWLPGQRGQHGCLTGQRGQHGCLTRQRGQHGCLTGQRG